MLKETEMPNEIVDLFFLAILGGGLVTSVYLVASRWDDIVKALRDAW